MLAIRAKRQCINYHVCRSGARLSRYLIDSVYAAPFFAEKLLADAIELVGRSMFTTEAPYHVVSESVECGARRVKYFTQYEIGGGLRNPFFFDAPRPPSLR